FWLATIAGLIGLVVLLHRAQPIDPLPQRKPLAALARALNAAVEVRHRRAAWAGSLALSVFLWFLHIVQIYVFYRAVAGNDPAPLAAVFMRVPVAIFIGLVPVTVAGIGTRDGALFALLAAWEPTAVIALVGLFCILRYVVMALAGLPVIISLGPTLTNSLRSTTGTDVRTQ
ncbi:MAG: lysylphosphatidylglycerol synthase domain-containing protein, partial [Alphaproteobacteria bacterium]